MYIYKYMNIYTYTYITYMYIERWAGWTVESRSLQRMTIHEPTNQSD